jgi:predicted phage-related endonuclease
MIDHALRLTGVGASEVGAICGIDPRRSAFDVYASKVGLLKRGDPTGRMKMGKRLERVIAEMYGEDTGRPVQWFDETMVNRSRPWQLCSPDAFIVKPGGVVTKNEEWPKDQAEFGLDCKNSAADQWDHWGESGTDLVPDTIAVQCQWSCSVTDLPEWHVAALIGGFDLRVYRIVRDPAIEEMLIEQVDLFWRNSVLARVPPPIESTDAAREYLRQRYPRNVEVMRPADETEHALITEWRQVKEEFDRAEKRKEQLQLQICDRIGSSDGLYFDAGEPGKIGRVNWQLGADVTVKEHVRKASRRFDCRVVKAKIGSRHLLGEKTMVTEVG